MKKSRKKIFALILSLIMLLDVTPLFVFAEDELAVDRSESQTVESLMAPAVNRKMLLSGSAPAGGQVNNRVTAEVYFLNTDGTRTNEAETASGNTLNARINLSNSSVNNSEDAYVKVSLAGLSDYVKLNEKFKLNEWDSITFRDMCKAFDPLKWRELHSKDTSPDLIGIRMVLDMVKDARYFNAFRSNNLILSLNRKDVKDA